ncbi:AraC family transcriptional regulator, partial [Klebsiella pneumoniae]|uniref:AraC family transcriptional regulator n=1 Tax=Klebsiella pneumoniae TaxID=573 RepID=UPI003CF042B1
GFSQTSYFCKVFRQTYQVTPQAFRQQIKEGANKFLIWGCHIHPERIPEGHHEPSTHLRR